MRAYAWYNVFVGSKKELLKTFDSLIGNKMAKKFSARAMFLAPHTAFTDDSIVTGKMKAKKRVTSAAAKVPNYTPEQVAKMVSDYTANPSKGTVESLAASLGKSVRSVVARLVREKNADGSKVYHAVAYKTKANEAPVKKEELADKLAILAGLTESEADAFTKATKTGLQKVVKALEDGAALRAEIDADYATLEDDRG